MRRLQHCQLRVLEEPADTHLEERTGRYVVGVENGHELAACDLERFVQVACLGVAVVVTNDVIHADLFAELAEVFAATVVKHMHAQFVLGPVDGLGGEDGDLHNVEGFVIRRDEHIDRRPLARRSAHQYWFASQRPGGLHIAEHQHDHRVQLGQDQAVAEQHVDPALEPEGGSESPVYVAQGSGQ
ncbi:hypothetical protein D3C76_720580 [compost metagenome]